jgi:thiosulfate reductase cytochrome b subunit
MKAELVLMGKRVDMAPQARRRALVILIYATLAMLMIGLFLADRWRTTGYYLVFATMLINRLFLGGYDFGGLIKPFNGKGPRRVEQPPPFLLLALRVYNPLPTTNAYRSDERELQQRDRAHYTAYKAVIFLLMPLWLLSQWATFTPRLLARIPVSPSLLIYGLVLASIIVALTLPQSILLWTEPDMEEAPN